MTYQVGDIGFKLREKIEGSIRYGRNPSRLITLLKKFYWTVDKGVSKGRRWGNDRNPGIKLFYRERRSLVEKSVEFY